MGPHPGGAGTAPGSARLQRWNRRMHPLVVVAAILPRGPIVAGDDSADAPEASVAVACWPVFVVDFVAERTLRPGFLSAWQGRLYLGIAIITAPAYLIVPTIDDSDHGAVARLGRVVVLAADAAHGMRGVVHLARRIGIASRYATAAVMVGAVPRSAPATSRRRPPVPTRRHRRPVAGRVRHRARRDPRARSRLTRPPGRTTTLRR